MSDTYYFEANKDRISLKCRSFEGVGNAEHSIVKDIYFLGEAELILDSLQKAIKERKEFVKVEVEKAVERLEGTVRQAQIDLELKRKELTRLAD